MRVLQGCVDRMCVGRLGCVLLQPIKPIGTFRQAEFDVGGGGNGEMAVVGSAASRGVHPHRGSWGWWLGVWGWVVGVGGWWGWWGG